MGDAVTTAKASSVAEPSLAIELPPEWPLAQLGDLFVVQQGKALSPKARKGENPHPFLRTANVLWGRLDLSEVDQMDFTEAELTRLNLEPGDLLSCEGGEVGRTAIWRGEIEGCSYQNHVHRLRTTSDVEPEFYMYWMQAALLLLGLYVGHENRTTIANLSKARLSKFVVPVPPLDEQRAIAGVLRSIQGAKEATEKVIAALRELRRSLVYHLLQYGVVPPETAEDVEMQETEVGSMPAHWSLDRLGDLADRPQYGVTASAEKQPRGPKMLRITDITELGVHWGGVPHVGHNEDLDRYRLFGGDIVIARIGATTGKHYLVKDPPHAVFASYLIRIRPHESHLTSEYLSLFMDSERYWTQVNANKGGRLKQGVNIGVLQDLRLPVPPVEEQEKIAVIIGSIDERLAAEQHRVAALREVSRSSLSDLMTGQRRVALPEVVGG